MCGRFVMALDFDELTQTFPWLKPPPDGRPASPNYNVAPAGRVPVVTNTGDRRLEFFQWGLVPFWAKDPAIAGKLINARAETVAEKPSFKHALRKRRCLILATGYFEWSALPEFGEGKTPVLITLKRGGPFAFAGLWEKWKPKDSAADFLFSCTIITTDPNEHLRKYHHRMPVVLRPESYDAWLDPGEKEPSELLPLLAPLPGSEFRVTPVSRRINNPRNNSADNIRPLGTDP